MLIFSLGQHNFFIQKNSMLYFIIIKYNNFSSNFYDKSCDRYMSNWLYKSRSFHTIFNTKIACFLDNSDTITVNNVISRKPVLVLYKFLGKLIKNVRKYIVAMIYRKFPVLLKDDNNRRVYYYYQLNRPLHSLRRVDSILQNFVV